MRHLIALLLTVALALPALAQDRPRAGLMWNRSGLPATLPLVVRTQPGRDHVVFLTPPTGGKPVMAGYIHGGTFFRLLVPPGTWAIRFAHGTDWQGEESLFGPQTTHSVMATPMTFEAGVARKHGHIIRLIESEGRFQIVSAGPLDLCQGLRLTSEVIELDDDRKDDPDRLPAPGLRRLDLGISTRNRVCG